MKKFSYKKLVDTLTFNKYSDNYFELTVHSIALHPTLLHSCYANVFRCCYPYAVCMAAQAFVAALASSDTLPTMELYHDGKLYTWHIDRYNHIIFRVYRVVK